MATGPDDAGGGMSRPNLPAPFRPSISKIRYRSSKPSLPPAKKLNRDQAEELGCNQPKIMEASGNEHAMTKFMPSLFPLP